ncbi:MAG: hypothetical protein K2V38_01470 [Gemmataceae bacterium]|nr:hypothetical protein [Gemmataceae bacterium]
MSAAISANKTAFTTIYILYNQSNGKDVNKDFVIGAIDKAIEGGKIDKGAKKRVEDALKTTKSEEIPQI